MSLVQISDTHLLCLKSNDAVAQQRSDNLQRCVDTINQMTQQPQAVVHTGDMINFGDENGYGLAHEILSQLKAPFFPTLGNRDSRPDLIEAFLDPDFVSKEAPFCQYRVEFEHFDLVCVDTKSATKRIGSSCPERITQIEKLLSRDVSKPVFIFLHHPPMRIETLKNPLQFESIEQAEALTTLFDKYDNIVRVLCGHTHRSDIVKMGCHTASTLPSLATDVRLDSYPDRFSDEPIFQVHELHADNSVTSMSHFTIQRLKETS